MTFLVSLCGVMVGCLIAFLAILVCATAGVSADHAPAVCLGSLIAGETITWLYWLIEEG